MISTLGTGGENSSNEVSGKPCMKRAETLSEITPVLSSQFVTCAVQLLASQLAQAISPVYASLVSSENCGPATGELCSLQAILCCLVPLWIRSQVGSCTRSSCVSVLPSNCVDAVICSVVNSEHQAIGLWDGTWTAHADYKRKQCCPSASCAPLSQKHSHSCWVKDPSVQQKRMGCWKPAVMPSRQQYMKPIVLQSIEMQAQHHSSYQLWTSNQSNTCTSLMCYLLPVAASCAAYPKRPRDHTRLLPVMNCWGSWDCCRHKSQLLQVQHPQSCERHGAARLEG